MDVKQISKSQQRRFTIMGKQYVRLKKLSVCSDPVLPSGDWETYVVGKDVENIGVSLPVEYTIEGYLVRLEVGYPLIIKRTRRNGIDVEGDFSSSVIMGIEGNKIETMNSIYLIEYLEKPNDSNQK